MNRMHKAGLSILIIFFYGIFSLQAQSMARNIKNYKVTDMSGRIVTFKALPQRIISSAPNITEMLFSFGLQSKIIGVTKSCNYPKAAQNIEKVAGSQLDIEKVIQLKPDLIVEESTLRMESLLRLKNLGFNIISIKCDNIGNFKRSMLILGSATGSKKKADSLLESFEGRMQKIQEKLNQYAVSKRVPVFIEIWNKPIITAGGNTFIDDIIRLSGGENIFGEIKRSYPKVNIESIIKRNPRVIILTTSKRDEILKEASWSGIPAVRSGRVYAINPDLLARPTLRMIEAIELISAWLHPELTRKNSIALKKAFNKSKSGCIK